MRNYKELLEGKSQNKTYDQIVKDKDEIALIGGGPLTFDEIDKLGWRMGMAEFGSSKGNFLVQFAASKKISAKDKLDFVTKEAKNRRSDAWFIKFK